MPKYLVVVESPAKAKTINKFLGRNYIVKACFGAVRDLPKSSLGVDVDNNFEPKYVTLREERARKAVKEIKDAAVKVDEILLASDPDREGEAIAWHVAEILRAYKKTADKASSRIIFNEITKRNVQEAVKNPKAINTCLVDAQQARRVVDRLVGYKLSPLLGWVLKKGLSAGRVQSVTVRMVVEREFEIREFNPVEYWSIDAALVTPRGDSFSARLHQHRGKSVRVGEDGQINSEAEATALLDALKHETFKVASVERKEVRRRPAPPFITSTLQQEASSKLGLSPARTMALAQQLYQGINVGAGGQVGLITYMRTDSVRLSQESLQDARAFIKGKYDGAYLPEKPNYFRNKKDAQDAHEAIRITSVQRTPDAVSQYLNEGQLKVYRLIWNRFVASQMTPAILDQTAVDIGAGECTFRASGSIMKFAGFTVLYREERRDPGGRDNKGVEKRSKSDAENILPEIKQGETTQQKGLKPEQHFTKPPPRYSEASLVRAMEENGIGRPSTYAPTIRTIMDRDYVKKEKGRLMPTSLGVEVNEWLVQNFPDVLSIDFTARLEDELDNVEEGKKGWRELTREFYGPFESNLKVTEAKMVAELVGDDPRCPLCNASAELKQSWFGMYMGCTRHPECKGTIRISGKSNTPPEPTDELCPECHAPMVIRTGRFGRFMACSTYPKCNAVINLDKNGKKLPPKPPPIKTDQDCPQCKKGKLLIRTSRAGEQFYGCERYPKCRHTRPMELDLPCPKEHCNGELEHRQQGRRRSVGCTKCDIKISGKIHKDQACSLCGNPWTLVSKPRGKPKIRKCPIATCALEEVIEEEETAEAT